MVELNEEAIAGAVRRREEAARLTLGATLVFVAVVIGPFVRTLVTRGLYLLKLGTAFPSPWQANTLEAARWFGLLLPLPFSISFAVGICCLTDLPERHRSIAKTWPGAARLLGLAYALVTSLTVFANLDGDFAEYDVLVSIRYHLDHVAEVVSVLVAAQHLRARGARRAALACKGLMLALLLNAALMLVAEIKIPPHMRFLSGFRASLAAGWWVALWLGALVALWHLRRAIQQTGNDGLPALPEAARERRWTRLFPASVPLGYALLVGGLSVVVSVVTGVLWTRAMPAPPAPPVPSAPSAPSAPAASDPCVPCEPSRTTRITL